jgi:signal transduction histidine kinase
MKKLQQSLSFTVVLFVVVFLTGFVTIAFADPTVTLTVLNVSNEYGDVVVVSGDSVEVELSVVDTMKESSNSDVIRLVSIADGTVANEQKRGRELTGSRSLGTQKTNGSNILGKLEVQYVSAETGQVMAVADKSIFLVDNQALVELTDRTGAVEEETVIAKEQAVTAEAKAFEVDTKAEATKVKMEMIEPKVLLVATKLDATDAKAEETRTKMAVMEPKVESVKMLTEETKVKMELLEPKVLEVERKADAADVKAIEAKTKADFVDAKAEETRTKMTVMEPKVQLVEDKMALLEPQVQMIETKADQVEADAATALATADKAEADAAAAQNKADTVDSLLLQIQELQVENITIMTVLDQVQAAIANLENGGNNGGGGLPLPDLPGVTVPYGEVFIDYCDDDLNSPNVNCMITTGTPYTTQGLKISITPIGIPQELVIAGYEGEISVNNGFNPSFFYLIPFDEIGVVWKVITAEGEFVLSSGLFWEMTGYVTSFRLGAPNMGTGGGYEIVMENILPDSTTYVIGSFTIPHLLNFLIFTPN